MNEHKGNMGSFPRRDIFQKLKKYILHPSAFRHYFLIRFIDTRFARILTDKCFIKLKYSLLLKKKLNLKNPQTYNEKLQWLKLYDRKPEYTIMADKFEVRKYIADTIGEDYLIPLLGIWDSFDDIDFDKLPAQFALKCTHDSGSVIICHDKNNFNKEEARKNITKSLKCNYFFHSREWCYKNIKPRIIAEKYLIDESGVELKDYKIFCFNGEPKIIKVDFNRFIDHKANFYSIQWEYLPITSNYPPDKDIIIKKPETLDLMLDLAGKLSSSLPHVRVDFYVIDKKIYFGELTFFHASGHTRFAPPEWDAIIGSWMKLPQRTG
ncbi:glycosyl transferase [Spirochaetia bacterium]|nr:glycosyl transferase [Spirochaetia bacterium]